MDIGSTHSDETKQQMSRTRRLRGEEKIRQYLNKVSENRELAESLMAKMDSDILPPCSGGAVYCVTVKNIYCSGVEHLLYIGSSIDMQNRRRRPRHPYRLAKSRFTGLTRAVFFKYYYTDDFKNDEELLIEVFSPPMNKLMNTKKLLRKTLLYKGLAQRKSI